MTLAVIGPGLIGTSIALAARRAWPAAEVLTIDRGQPLGAARAADIVVLAAPVDAILDIVSWHGHELGDGVLIDTGSSKRAIVAAARHARLTNFVGGHPMAGGATSGSRDARADLFDGKPWFLVPHGAEASTVARAQAMVIGLGATPVLWDDDGREHDRVMAAVSHLPQVVASALMAVSGVAAGPDGLQWAGAGLKDTTRLAASSGSLWESVVATNAAELGPLLTTLADELREIAGRLDDPQAVRRLFEAANRYRALLK